MARTPRRSGLLPLALLGLAGCVGTPVPVPIPINEDLVRLSSPPASGADPVVVAMGLAGAASGAESVVVTNLDSSEVRQGRVFGNGTFAVAIPAAVDDRLELATRIEDVVSAGQRLSVPKAAGVPRPTAWASLPDKVGKVTVSGTARDGDQVLVSAPATGELRSATAGGKGAFSATLAAKVGDTLYAVAVDGQQRGSEHLALTVTKQSLVCTDFDGDTYGASGSSLSTCTGSTSQADCDDNNKQVNPGQQQYFTTPITGSTSDYDYNCDGKQEPQDSALASCTLATCSSGHGWQTTVPACGQSGTWVQCVLAKSVCNQQPQTKVQACR